MTEQRQYLMLIASSEQDSALPFETIRQNIRLPCHIFAYMRDC